MPPSVSLKEMARRHSPIICGWCTIPAQLSAEIVEHSGVDVMLLDAQHGMMGWDTVLALTQALTPATCPVLVRVPSQSEENIMHALDAGADGVVVPFVNTAAEADRAARACRYPPRGSRSWGPWRQMAREDVDTEAANAAVVCLVMVETSQGVANAADIASVDGVDGILLGANDLALTMTSAARNVAQVRSSDDFRDARIRVAGACAGANIIAAAPGPTMDEARTVLEMGYRMLVLSSEGAILRNALRDTVTAIRALR